eukprot:7450982-Pyramimonas_sp.AAC.1
MLPRLLWRSLEVPGCPRRSAEASRTQHCPTAQGPLISTNVCNENHQQKPTDEPFAYHRRTTGNH